MIILCEYCDLRYVCYDDWMEHLLSSKHQDVIGKAINSWEPSLNERSLVITINGTKPEKTDICWYFASYGLVSDAFFESDLDFCVIQLDKKDYATNAVSAKHSMEKANLSLRLKSDITDAEWLLLNKSGRRNSVEDLVNRRNELKESFENRHTKLSKTLTSLPLDRQMEIFERETRMSSSEFILRQNLVKDINRLFNRDYPKCVLCPYGSFVTGLGNKFSVLHMYFDAIGLSKEDSKCYQGILPPKKEIMESLEKCIGRINQKQLFCHDFVVLPRDATPSIKFTHYVSGVTCRFTFESLLPVQTSKLISLVMKLDPRLPCLFLFVRYWGQKNKITGPHLITSYSLNLLLLVFLTTKKIIPSVAALQSMGNDIKEINGWETSFCDDKEKIVNVMSFLGVSSAFATNPTTGNPTAKSILELAVDFFKMFAHSDLQSQVVCSVIGDFLPKSAFERGNEADLPKGLEAYKTRISIQKRRLNTSSLLCIQDPFDLVANVSSATPEDTIWKFQFLCADTIDNIETILNSSDLNLMDIFNVQLNDSTKQTKNPVPAVSAAGTATAQPLANSYLSRENQSTVTINSSSRYSYEESSVPCQNISQYDNSHIRQNDPAYMYPQTRDMPFSYGSNRIQQQPEPTPHHPDVFHHSQQHQDPNLHHSDMFHQQNPTPHHPDMFHHLQQQQQHHPPPDIFHQQQYSSSQHFDSNEMFAVPHHLQSYHQTDSQACGPALLPNPPMSQNPPQFQRFPSLNPPTDQRFRGNPPSTKSKSASQTTERHLVPVQAAELSSSRSVVAPPPPALSTIKQALVKPPTAPGPGIGVVHKPKNKQKTKNQKNKIKLRIQNSDFHFGDMEKILIYPPDEDFQRLFKENFGNLVSESILNLRLKVLWCMFMKDFFSDVWWKSFLFEVAEISQFSIPVSSNLARLQANKSVVNYRNRSSANEADEPPDPKKQKVVVDVTEAEEKPIIYIFPSDQNPNKRKFFELQIKFLYCNAFICTIPNNNFLVGRGRIRSNAFSDQDLLAKFPDPLDWEGNISKIVMNTKKCQAMPAYPSEFVAKISLDAEKEESVSLILKDMFKDIASKGNIKNSMSHIISVLRNIIPKYSIFRLKKWLSTDSP